jgi:phosphoribosylamine--glycine ligase
LKGIEISVFIITDGTSYKILPSAKDYKRIGDGDAGLNTGGMGAVSPVPFADREFMEKVDLRIIRPTVRGFAADEMPYQGFVFIGLMNVKGEPYVIEYNVRLGDPETEAVLPRLKSDLLDLFDGIASGTLSECDVNIDLRTTATVMMVADGYPGDYEKGKAITHPDKIDKGLIFHAGTKSVGGRPVSNGGRVIAVTSYGKNIEDARKKCYEAVEKVEFEGKYYRKDIGVDLIKKEPQKAKLTGVSK